MADAFAFDKDAKDGDVVTLENGVAYQYDAAKDRWLVKAVAGSGAGADWGFPLPEDQVAYVKKEGGDDMEGPLVIKAQDPSVGRDTNKVHTLGVFSNSMGSALRLGTTRDRVYVGHDDTAFNGPIKVDEIQEKNADVGVNVSNRLVLGVEGEAENEAVTKGYVDSADQHLQTKIDELEQELDIVAPRLGVLHTSTRTL